MPGTTSSAIPAARQAAISSLARPRINGSPLRSRTTRLPALASAMISAVLSFCLRGSLAGSTSIFSASRRAKSRMAGETGPSIKMTSADCSARNARSVNSSGSPGSASTSVTLPAPASCLPACMQASKSDGAGSRSEWARAKAVNACQNRRRAANASPDERTAGRQRRAASTQCAKPSGIMASSLARMA
jgi:hypothetical protein